jgi:putative transposase
LRQQVAVLRRRNPRPRLRPSDRLSWVWLSRWCGGWRSWLAIVQPETVIGWHRQGFHLYWRLKSRGGKPCRPAVSAQVRRLIRRMSTENPTWGAPRIQAELRLLGYALARSTVAKSMRRRPKTKRAFLSYPRKH